MRSTGNGRALERFFRARIQERRRFWDRDRDRDPPLAAAALGRHPVVLLGTAASEDGVAIPQGQRAVWLRGGSQSLWCVRRDSGTDM